MGLLDQVVLEREDAVIEDALRTLPSIPCYLSVSQLMRSWYVVVVQVRGIITPTTFAAALAA
jgi:hypothetical protein